jgi:tetratricopeptide (TPR) repeat protein
MKEPRYRFFGGNFNWGESWPDYLRRKPFTRDLYQMQREAASEIVRAISDQTRKLLVGRQAPSVQIVQNFEEGGMHDVLDILKEMYASQRNSQSERNAGTILASSMIDGLDMLMGSFGHGIDQISSKLDSLSEGVAELNSTFQWGFGEIIYSLGGIKDGIAQINKTLRTPLQTRAAEKFEIARSEFDRGHYSEALRYANKAIKDFDLDWRFYALRGVIRLGSVHGEIELVNPASAEKAFLKAARYSTDRVVSAKFMLQAAWSAFVQHRLDEGLAHATEAVKLDDTLGEGWFQLAKFHMVGKNVQAGISALDRAIDLDIGYILKSDTDSDFDPGREEMQRLFESKRKLVLGRILTSAGDPEVARPEPALLEGSGLLELLEIERKFNADCNEAKRKRQEHEAKKQEVLRRIGELMARLEKAVPHVPYHLKKNFSSMGLSRLLGEEQELADLVLKEEKSHEEFMIRHLAWEAEQMKKAREDWADRCARSSPGSWLRQQYEKDFTEFWGFHPSKLG